VSVNTHSSEFESLCSIVALAVGLKYSVVVRRVLDGHVDGHTTQRVLLLILEEKMK
jgi:hypothetical protein